MSSLSTHGLVLAFLLLPLTGARAELPEVVAASAREQVLTTVHAQGAQIYECKADASGKLVWQFREPIATLFLGGKTVGRHYAGPNWELADTSAVIGKVIGRASGATPTDIPLLKLVVISRRGTGQLSKAASIQRLNTKGGVAEGPCASAGKFLSVPYSADYVFRRRPD